MIYTENTYASFGYYYTIKTTILIQISINVNKFWMQRRKFCGTNIYCTDYTKIEINWLKSIIYVSSDILCIPRHLFYIAYDVCLLKGRFTLYIFIFYLFVFTACSKTTCVINESWQSFLGIAIKETKYNH